MFRAKHRVLAAAVAAFAALSSGCIVSEKDEAAPDSQVAVQPAAPPAAGPVAQPLPADTTGMAGAASGSTAAAPVSDMRVEVDVNARRLYLYKGQERVATHRVAVGSSKWPTQTGEWKITQVVWNPEWTPPDESWAEQREPREPGDPKNPLGRVQLVYDPPRTIHGTNEPASIGKAVSHGSIRLANEVAVEVAKQLMESAGVGKDETWYRERQENRKKKEIVDLPGGVPIRVF